MNNAIDADTANLERIYHDLLIETVHVIVSPFPGLTGTYTVRRNDVMVGWVSQVAPAHQVRSFEAINMDGDVTTSFATVADAAAYLQPRR